MQRRVSKATLTEELYYLEVDKMLISRRPRRLGIAVLSILLLAACQKTSDRVEEGAPTTADAELPRGVSPEEFEGLMALGYLEATEGTVDTTQVGVVHIDADRVQDGYRLYCTRGSAIAELIDLEGAVVHRWKDDQTDSWTTCALAPNGDLLVVGIQRDRSGSEGELRRNRHIQRLSWDGQEIWKRELPMHHDIFVLPDGDSLTLQLEYRWKREIHDAAQVRDDFVVHLSAEGEVLDRRSILEVFESHPDELTLRLPARMDEGGSSPVDLIHANTVESVRWPHLVDSDPIYATGNVIWTSRRQNIVAIVDWESNRLLWSWGQDELLGPHEGRVLASGNILIFDNGTKRTGSRVIEVDPMSREIVWEYRGKSPQDFFTSGRGGAERLANGNTLITESAKGRAFEVSPEGEQVWIFLTPHLTREDHRLTFRRMRHFSRDSIDRIRSAQSSR